MVGGTRSTPGGFYQGEGSGTYGGQGPPPPPPPPPQQPTLAQMYATQTEILRQLTQDRQQYQPRHGGHRYQQAQVADYQDFLGTQPPVFTPSDEPLDADAWIRVLESKFALITAPLSEESKARFMAQQLRGIAKIWWDE